jgi:hypothetical protein
MKRLLCALSFVAAAIPLTGCSGATPSADAHQIESSNRNSSVCRDFEEETAGVASDMVEFRASDDDDSMGEILAEAGYEFEQMASEATGPVSESLSELSKFALANSRVVKATTFQEYLGYLESVRWACSGEGVEIADPGWKLDSTRNR